MSFWTGMAITLLLTAAVRLVLWLVKDAMSRGKSPLLVVIAVVLFSRAAWLRGYFFGLPLPA